MADVHQIIDLDAATDDGGIERSPVNGSVGADLHVVADLQAADLRKGLVAAGLLVAHVAEAGAAQHRPGVHRHPVAQAGTGIDGDVVIDEAIASNGYAIGDAASRPDAGVLAQNAIFAQHHVGSNGDMLPDLGRTMHYRGGVDAGRLAARFV